jgi:uncharacterized protein
LKRSSAEILRGRCERFGRRGKRESLTEPRLLGAVRKSHQALLYYSFSSHSEAGSAVFFSIRDLELKKVYFDVTFAPGEIEYLDKLRQSAPLEAQGSAELLANTLGEIRIRGHLKTVMEADCDRCLEPALEPVDTDFDLFYRPEIQAESGAEEIALGAGEIEIAFYRGDGIDLKEVLREQILLSLPMQRVCRPDCRGICPMCGQNRNLTDCGCEIRKADDRWAALKTLQTKGN